VATLYIPSNLDQLSKRYAILVKGIHIDKSDFKKTINYIPVASFLSLCQCCSPLSIALVDVDFETADQSIQNVFICLFPLPTSIADEGPVVWG
jgi:hypothetical protein